MDNKLRRKTENYIKENQNDLYRFAYSYAKNEADALDIVQESIYKALRNSNSLKDSEKIKSWIFTIIRNTSLTYLKKSKREIPCDDISESIDEDKIEKSEKIYLESIINNLENDFKEIIILRFFEDMKFREIANILHLNINTVKSRTYKALEKLKILYEGGIS